MGLPFFMHRRHWDMRHPMLKERLQHKELYIHYRSLFFNRKLSDNLLKKVVYKQCNGSNISKTINDLRKTQK